MKTKAKFTVTGGIIAALYVALTMATSVFGLSSGPIQIRLSEALCILPMLTPAAIPGLFVGCIISNLLSGCLITDVIFGSLATLLGAVGTYFLRQNKFWAIIPPIASNTLIIPLVFKYCYHIESAVWYMMLTVGIGEILSCGFLGLLLYKAAAKFKMKLY